MPKLVASLVFLVLLSVLLCGPVLYVALRLRRQGDFAALRPLRTIWLAQFLVAAALMLAADLANVARLHEWLAAILLGVSFTGAAAFWTWRRMARWRARMR